MTLNIDATSERSICKADLSVLMAVYNGADCHLSETIESILNQSFRNFEFVIVNDGSTDETPEILALYSAQDRRIRVLTNEINLGICESLNRGLEVVRHQLIARMDCGDIAEPQRFERCYDFMVAHPDHVLVSSQVVWFDGNNNVIRRTAYPTDDMSIRKRLLAKDNVIVNPATMFRRIDNIAYRRQAEFAEDYDLCLRLSLYGRMSIIDEPLLRVRYIPKGTTYSKKIQQMKAVDAIYKNFMELLVTGRVEEIKPYGLNKFEVFQQKMFFYCSLQSNRANNLIIYWWWKVISLLLTPEYLFWMIYNSVRYKFINKKIIDNYIINYNYKNY